MKHSGVAHSIGWLLAATLLGGCGVTAEPAGATSTTEVMQATAASITDTPAAASETARPAVREAGCVAGDLETADDSATLTLGPAEGIAATTAGGEPMVIVGIVLDPGCQPVPGASFNLWQTDGDGVYGPGHETNNLECCYYQGRVTADDQGRFKLITVRPGHYKGQNPPPPAHIHVEGVGKEQGYGSEIVFADDPYLPVARDNLIIVSLTQTDGVIWSGVAVVVLEKS